MFVNCPNCGSKHIRHSHYQSFGERFLSLFGVHQLRCKDCQHRFASRVFRLVDLYWSKCPRCYRMDLSSWNEDHYLPKWGTKVKMRLGAKRLRCEYCRLNFAGWRPVKMKYQWRRRKKEETPVPVDVDASVDKQVNAQATATEVSEPHAVEPVAVQPVIKDE
ncbi:MAG: hypothetical protein HY820_03275 [Acidobacteria bacterium]|nr:hypothetical protein [Acidobacteriota bacterium]